MASVIADASPAAGPAAGPTASLAAGSTASQTASQAASQTGQAARRGTSVRLEEPAKPAKNSEHPTASAADDTVTGNARDTITGNTSVTNMPAPRAIDPVMPCPCFFCGTDDANLQACAIPWRLPLTGWWCCRACHSVAEACCIAASSRSVLSVAVLPDWMREWGAMDALRSDGKTLTSMMIEDTAPDASVTSDVIGRWGGRLYRSRGEIYVDMYWQDQHIHRKSVRLLNILQHNPDLLSQNPPLTLQFPAWIAEHDRKCWNNALARDIAACASNDTPVVYW